MRFLAFTFLTFCGTALFAQVPVELSFSFRNGGTEFETGETMTALNGVSYRIDDIAFYVSQVDIIHDGGQHTTIDSVYLFSDHQKEIVLENLDVTNVEGIGFLVGVPVELNHLDITQYPDNHPLSYQTPSMFWGWSAGYMHFIMSGYGDNDNNSSTLEYAYQLHCLGDENAMDVNLVTTATLLPDNTRKIILFVNVDQWLEGTDPATTGILHGSDGLNQDVMQNVALNPVFVSPTDAGIQENAEQLEIKVYQLTAETTVAWQATNEADHYDLTDSDGRITHSGSCNANSGSLTFSGLESGLHILRITNKKNSILGTAKWVTP